MFNHESGGSATPNNDQPLTRSELEADMARMLDERLTQLESRVEHVETQKMHRDTDVARNTQRLDQIEWKVYSLNLGCDHRYRDIA